VPFGQEAGLGPEPV